MSFDEALRSQLIADEALRLSLYKDSEGYLTIGVGHNLDAKPISKRAAMTILDDDIADAVADLDRALPWWRNMDDTRRLVLADMAFNLGINKLLGFKNALAAMQAGRYEMAAAGMLDSEWARQVGKRATRLAQMMRGGE